jgi:hypothetical protein
MIKDRKEAVSEEQTGTSPMEERLLHGITQLSGSNAFFLGF